MATTPTTLLGNASLSETKQAQLRFSLRFRRQRVLLALLHAVGGTVLAADAGSQTFRISPSIGTAGDAYQQRQSFSRRQRRVRSCHADHPDFRDQCK